VSDGQISVVYQLVFAVDTATMLYDSNVIAVRPPMDSVPRSAETVNGEAISAPATVSNKFQCKACIYRCRIH
jgi:hypothetical protein